jgi:hypothetical protein
MQGDNDYEGKVAYLYNFNGHSRMQLIFGYNTNTRCNINTAFERIITNPSSHAYFGSYRDTFSFSYIHTFCYTDCLHHFSAGV